MTVDSTPSQSADGGDAVPPDGSDGSSTSAASKQQHQHQRSNQPPQPQPQLHPRATTTSPSSSSSSSNSITPTATTNINSSTITITPSSNARSISNAHHNVNASASGGAVGGRREGGKGSSSSKTSVPIPPPNAHSHDKQPGYTRPDLEKLHLTHPHPPQGNNATPTSTATATKLPPPSPAPAKPSAASTTTTAPTTTTTAKTPSKPKSRSGSLHSVDGDKHRFNLKDLLSLNSGGITPKLSRRSSQSSRKSDSDSGYPHPHPSSSSGAGERGERGGGAKSVGGGGGSVAGDSATSLSTKYGVCGKVAIGKGATSVVRLAHKWDRSEEKLYAVKEFRKRRKTETEKEYIKKLTAEFCISSTLHHINIVETVDLIQDENQHWCEVMEFCPGGDLYAAIKRGGMSPSEVECCFRQILEGVRYLHSQGVAHRDLKPENLFFDTKGHLKIGDYGASTVYRLPWEATIHMSTGLCGSEPYIAPEQFLGKPYDARLVDIWACGIIYYCLHFQELPWRSAQLSDPLYSAYHTACSSPSPSVSSCPPTINNLSPRACRGVIRRMLEPSWKGRWTVEEVLEDRWVKGIEVCWALEGGVESASHVHVNARALAAQQFGNGGV